MTPDARAVIASTLLQHLLAVAERSQRRKFICGIGVGRSDMGRGERGSAYATLYNQTVIDETLTWRNGQAHRKACALDFRKRSG